MPNQPATPQHNVRIPADLWRRWVALAREEGMSMSEVIRAELARWEQRVRRRRGQR